MGKEVTKKGGKIYIYGCIIVGTICLIGMLIFTGAALQSSIPQGAVMFFNLPQCPEGWDKVVAAEGRYIVGLPANGTLGATVGVALKDNENRAVGKHTHAILDPGHIHNIKAIGQYDGSIKAFLSGSTNAANNINSETTKTGIAIQEAGDVEGTNAPYIQLMVCEKK